MPDCCPGTVFGIVSVGGVGKLVELAQLREQAACSWRPRSACRRRPRPRSGRFRTSSRCRPDSNAPSSFDAPMNIEFTALTRPRIASGVSSCTSRLRTNTLTMSPAPAIASMASDSQKLVESPNTMVAKPNDATPPNIQRPACRLMGRIPSPNATMAAPTAGAARRNPRPRLSTCRMLSAYTGSSATAPPNNTANRSSEIAPSTGFLCHTNLKPSSKSCQCHSVAACARTGRTPAITSKVTMSTPTTAS